MFRGRSEEPELVPMTGSLPYPNRFDRSRSAGPRSNGNRTSRYRNKYAIHTCNTNMPYIHVIQTCHTIHKYKINTRSNGNRTSRYRNKYAIHTCNTNMPYIHVIQTCHTIHKYKINTRSNGNRTSRYRNKYPIHTCNTNMPYNSIHTSKQTCSTYIK